MFIPNFSPFGGVFSHFIPIFVDFWGKSALYFYKGNGVRGRNPAARSGSPFYEFSFLDALGPLVGKLLSIAIR